jgi:hypothetical protein
VTSRQWHVASNAPLTEYSRKSDAGAISDTLFFASLNLGGTASQVEDLVAAAFLPVVRRIGNH